MLTQIQITEPQAAILAACPRPRAAVSFAAPVCAPRVPGAVWSRTLAPIAASVRRPGSVVERPQAGYVVNRVPADAVRVELGGKGSAGIAMRGTDQQNLQDKQHLTTRRVPVTWRPPH